MPGRDCSTVTRTSFGNSRAQVAKKAAGCFSAVYSIASTQLADHSNFQTAQASSDLDVR
jgi:hypothetical protein